MDTCGGRPALNTGTNEKRVGVRCDSCCGQQEGRQGAEGGGVWGPAVDDALSKANRNTVSCKGYFQFYRNKNPQETRCCFVCFFK